ncbi:MAG: iron-containing alcohol dehydrogenase, partial [Anaerovoracaceae bacterium]
KGAALELPLLARQFGRRGLLAHGNSLQSSGTLDRILSAASDDMSVRAWRHSGGEPSVDAVDALRAALKADPPDWVAAVGGGSVIDSAKAIGYGAAEEGDVWELYDYKRQAKACLPVGVILTIAAAGSEMSNSSVITKEDGWIKRGYGSELCRPRFAVMNPELTYTLPHYQTMSGCTDILMHTMERYFNKSGSMEMTDRISEALLNVVMKSAKVLRTQPENYEARAEVMWAGSLSHNDLTGCGNDGGDWSSHRLEHELGGMFDVAHGAGLAAVWGSWARYVFEEGLDRFSAFAWNVMDVSRDFPPKEAALAGIEAMEDFFRSIDIPVSVSDLGVELTEEQIDELAEKCSIGDTITIGVIKKLKKSDMAEIYRMAK